MMKNSKKNDNSGRKMGAAVDDDDFEKPTMFAGKDTENGNCLCRSCDCLLSIRRLLLDYLITERSCFFCKRNRFGEMCPLLVGAS